MSDGTYMASFFGSRIWDTLPEICQNTNSLLVFIEKIKKWIPRTALVKFANIMLKTFGFCNIADGI